MAALGWAGVFLQSKAADAGTEALLVYERFENSSSGRAEGGVRFDRDAIGHGGLAGAENHFAAFFDGRPGTCVVYDAAQPIGGDFTVEAFVKPAARGGYLVIAALWNEDPEERAWALVVTPRGQLRFDVSPDGRFHPENMLLTGPRTVVPKKWVHVAAVSRASTSSIFVNGRELGRLDRPRPGIHAAKARLRIGSADRYATAGPRPFHGWLDEVRISPKALTPAEFLTTREPLPEIRPAGPPAQYALPFQAKTAAEALAWQQQARTRLFELVAAQQPRLSAAQAPIDFQIGAADDRGSYLLYPMSFRGNNRDGRRYQGLFAVPKGTGPFPALLALHGHGGNAAVVFDRKSIYAGFADRFAQGGYVVLAPSLPHHDFAALALWDLLRCVDILAGRPEVDRERIGVGGLSMGGEWTMWAAACDLRLKAAVVSGWMCTTEGVFAVPNCECWELPGFVEQMDVCEAHLLIAPRPVLFESAEFDECFPVRYTRQGFARIRAGYAVFGAAGAVQQDVWPAGHRWHGAAAYPFIDRALGGRVAKVPD